MNELRSLKLEHGYAVSVMNATIVHGITAIEQRKIIRLIFQISRVNIVNPKLVQRFLSGTLRCDTLAYQVPQHRSARSLIHEDI